MNIDSHTLDICTSPKSWKFPDRNFNEKQIKNICHDQNILRKLLHMPLCDQKIITRLIFPYVCDQSFTNMYEINYIFGWNDSYYADLSPKQKWYLYTWYKNPTEVMTRNTYELMCVAGIKISFLETLIKWYKTPPTVNQIVLRYKDRRIRHVLNLLIYLKMSLDWNCTTETLLVLNEINFGLIIDIIRESRGSITDVDNLRIHLDAMYRYPPFILVVDNWIVIQVGIVYGIPLPPM
jgi:hypothetical protein